MTSSFVFNSLDLTLNYLKDCTRQTNEIKDLLNLYEQAKCQHFSSPPARNYLFVVFEGLDGSGKTTMCNMVSEQVNAVQVPTPPKCIHHLRAYFDNNCEPKLRRAYYSLGNYIAAIEIEALLSTKHVVMDRFWHSTAAYTLAESSTNLPIKGDVVYQWPEDLLKPDVVIFLTVQENLRVARTARRPTATLEEEKLQKNNEFRSKLYEAYSNMKGLTYIESNAPPKPVFRDIMESVLNPLIEKCH